MGCNHRWRKRNCKTPMSASDRWSSPSARRKLPLECAFTLTAPCWKPQKMSGVRVLQTRTRVDRESTRTILCDDDPVFVLYRVASRYGLPVVPEWAPWFLRELNQRKSIRPLMGLGCSPVLVSGNKPTFLKWIGKALREGLIRIPKENGSIAWKLPTNMRPPPAAMPS